MQDLGPDDPGYLWRNTTTTTTTTKGIHIRPRCLYQYSHVPHQNTFDRMSPIFTRGSAFASTSGGFHGTGELLALFRDGNMSLATVGQTFDRMAEALTVAAREFRRGQPLAEPALGLVWTTDTCIRVEWGWIAFPAALVVATLVFLAAVVVRARHGGELGRQSYKTSVLPLMFHVLERRREPARDPVASPPRRRRRQGKAAAVALEGMGEMQAEAGRLRVRLEETEGGWRFKE